MSKYDNSDQRSVKTLSRRSLIIALSVLEAFQESSLYDDYQREDRWKDSEFTTLIWELNQMKGGKK